MYDVFQSTQICQHFPNKVQILGKTQRHAKNKNSNGYFYNIKQIQIRGASESGIGDSMIRVNWQI